MHVGEQSNAWPKEQLRSDDVIGGQLKGASGEEFEQRAHFKPVTHLPFGSSGDGLSSSGPAEGLVGSKWADGPLVQGPLLLKGAATVGVGPAFGPSEERAANGLKFLPCGPAIMLGGSPGPSQAQLHDRGLSLKFCA